MACRFLFSLNDQYHQKIGLAFWSLRFYLYLPIPTTMDFFPPWELYHTHSFKKKKEIKEKVENGKRDFDIHAKFNGCINLEYSLFHGLIEVDPGLVHCPVA